jgi:hypothetical protein
MGYSSSSVVIPPAPAASPLLDADFRKNTKAKRTICDAVKDHIIPHLTGEDYVLMNASM